MKQFSHVLPNYPKQERHQFNSCATNRITTSQASEVIWSDVALSQRNDATKRMYWSGDCPLRKLFKKVLGLLGWHGNFHQWYGGTIEFWFGLAVMPALVTSDLCGLTNLWQQTEKLPWTPRSFPSISGFYGRSVRKHIMVTGAFLLCIDFVSIIIIIPNTFRNYPDPQFFLYCFSSLGWYPFPSSLIWKTAAQPLLPSTKPPSKSHRKLLSWRP